VSPRPLLRVRLATESARPNPTARRDLSESLKPLLLARHAGLPRRLGGRDCSPKIPADGVAGPCTSRCSRRAGLRPCGGSRWRSLGTPRRLGGLCGEWSVVLARLRSVGHVHSWPRRRTRARLLARLPNRRLRHSCSPQAAFMKPEQLDGALLCGGLGRTTLGPGSFLVRWCLRIARELSDPEAARRGARFFRRASIEVMFCRS